MNILILCKIFEKSGVGSHIKSLSEGLMKRGHRVIIASGTNKHEEFLSENGIEFRYVEFSTKPVAMAKSLGVLSNIIKENKIDIVHCHHRTCSFYMQILNIFRKTPFVWSNHLNDIPYDFIHRVTTFYGARAICVSTDLKEFCKEKLHIPEDKICVVYNGIEPERYSADTEWADEYREEHNLCNEKIIMMFSRMAPMKGHIFLIRAFASIPKNLRSDVRIVFSGGVSGEYVDSLKTEIREKGLEKYFDFIGFVEPNQAFALADILVAPSINEGFLITALEAFYFKKPVIRTKTGGYSDMADFCVGVDVGDVEGLAKELTYYVQGMDYSNMVEKAYNFVKEQCTVDAMTENILDIYGQVLREQARHG